jgi:uncharacterized damage-inducible protein DinB
MAQNVAITVQGRTVMSAPREVLVRNIMLNHVYHHRGQLGVYLRLLGASVPSQLRPQRRRVSVLSSLRDLLTTMQLA